MKLIGKILWIAFIGLWAGIGFTLSGIVMLLSIIFIPFAGPCFRIAKVVFCPFDKEVTIDTGSRPVLTILWMIFGGLESAAAYAVLGALLCVTIIGIPAGKQCFKIMKLCAFPYGASIG